MVFCISTEGKPHEDGKFFISPNSAGLASLAIHLLTLAQDSVQPGWDVLYGDW
jgi:hypothetical protein